MATAVSGVTLHPGREQLATIVIGLTQSQRTAASRVNYRSQGPNYRYGHTSQAASDAPAVIKPGYRNLA